MPRLGDRRRLESEGQVEAGAAVAPLEESDSVFQCSLRVQMADGHLQTDRLSGNELESIYLKCTKLSSNVDFCLLL